MAEIIFGIDHGNGNMKEKAYVSHVDLFDMCQNREDL